MNDELFEAGSLAAIRTKNVTIESPTQPSFWRAFCAQFNPTPRMAMSRASAYTHPSPVLSVNGEGRRVGP